MNKIILVASGKGGAGKTTVSSNLAACLEKSGKKILLIDADLSLRNLDLVLGVQDKTVFDIQDLFRGDCTEQQAMAIIPGHPELRFIAAPMCLDTDEALLCKFIYNYAKNKSYTYDNVIIDCPAGIGNCIKCLVHSDTSVLCISTPDITSVRDAEKLATLVRSYSATDVRLIVNRINTKLIRAGFAPNMDEIIDSVSVQLIGLIPEDEHVSAYANRGMLVSDSKRLKVHLVYENIAARVSGTIVPLYKFW